ncbi:MAG: tetratricopeptide repeat protein [Planctomycetota bacterium]|jgi:Tfp pilus assembly protein PilF
MFSVRPGFRFPVIIVVFLPAILACGCFASTAGNIAQIDDPEGDRYNRAVREFNLGIGSLTENDYANAAAHFRKAVKIEKSFFEADLHTALTYDLFLEQSKEAEKIYKRLLKSRPNDYRLRQLLGVEKSKAKTSGRAKKKEKKKPAGKTPKKTKNAALIRARGAMAKPDYRLALREFQDSKDEELSETEESEILQGIGVCYAAINQVEAARDTFRIVLVKNPRIRLEAGKYPDRVYRIFSEIQAQHPSLFSITVKTAHALVLLEPIVFEFSATAI